MDTRHLSDKDAYQIKEIISKHNLGEIDAYVRFWGRKTTVQIDGDLTSQELKCLLEIAEYLEC